MQAVLSWAAVVLLAAAAAAQPFQPGTGFAPLGNLRTMDRDGPYNLTLLPVQANEIRGEIFHVLPIHRSAYLWNLAQATWSADLSGPTVLVASAPTGLVARSGMRH